MRSENPLKEFKNYLNKEHLISFTRLIKVSLGLFIIDFLLVIIIYVTSTYLQFIRIDSTGFYFDYYKWLNIIEFCSILTWIAMISLSFLILLYYLQIISIINPRLELLQKRKEFEKKKIAQKTGRAYKKKMTLKILVIFIIIICLILWLNYYPRNAQLFYPFIGCNANTGICIITAEAFYPFILIMNGFLMVLALLFLGLIVVNIKELKILRRKLYPKKIEQKSKEKMKDLKNKAEIKTMDISERKKRKLEEIREEYRRKQQKKRKKRQQKYMKMLKKEKYGKQGYKKLKEMEEKKVFQEEEEEEKEKRKKKDKFDFT